jgi:hypothetical protein
MNELNKTSLELFRISNLSDDAFGTDTKEPCCDAKVNPGFWLVFGYLVLLNSNQ